MGHNGKLDDDGDIIAYQEQVFIEKYGSLSGVWLACERGYIMDNVGEDFVGVSMSPIQALALLAWLEERKPALERLAGVVI